MTNPRLTERQIKLLRVIIQEFMDTAEAVGSIHLPTKYSLGVSPATIRNEMMNLAKKGLLAKSHVSAGRIPTSAGFRYFINEIVDELAEFEAGKEANLKEEIFQNRFNADNLLYEAVHKLSELTDSAAIGIFNGKLYLASLTSMLDNPEYHDLSRFKRVLSSIENPELMNRIFKGVAEDGRDIHVVIGKDDIGNDIFEKTAIIFGKLRLYQGNEGYIGIIGPNRMDYSAIIPSVKWMVNTINKSIEGW